MNEQYVNQVEGISRLGPHFVDSSHSTYVDKENTLSNYKDGNST